MSGWDGASPPRGGVRGQWQRRQNRKRRQRLYDLMRVACTVDKPEEVSHPARAALAPRLAIGMGYALLILALGMGIYAVMSHSDRSPGGDKPGMSASAPDGASEGGGLGHDDGGVDSRSDASGGSGGSEGRGGGSSVNATTGKGPGSHAGVVESSGPGRGMSGSRPGQGSGAADGQGEILVHVSGEVALPGVVRLHVGDRVADALQAAGGATTEGNVEALNLARPLSDGEKIVVPSLSDAGSVTPDDPAGSAGVTAESLAGASSGVGEATNSASAGGGRVSLNAATASDLQRVKGIGPALAQRIIEYRTAHGAFRRVDDLLNVPGIGPATLRRLRDQVTL